MSPTGVSEAKTLERFEGGLIDLYRRQGLFYQNPKAVEISEGVLYRARIPVPARVPVGNYRAETYLISKGRVIAVASRDVEIRKAGFERFVALAAERHGFLYRSEEHTSELQSLMRISYAVFCLKKKK